MEIHEEKPQMRVPEVGEVFKIGGCVAIRVEIDYLGLDDMPEDHMLAVYLEDGTTYQGPIQEFEVPETAELFIS